MNENPFKFLDTAKFVPNENERMADVVLAASKVEKFLWMLKNLQKCSVGK